MTLSRFLLGVPLAALALVPLAFAVRNLRRRLLPGWTGGDTVLADLVLGLTGVVLAGELSGTLGVFGAAGLVVACLAVAGLTELLARRWPETSEPDPPEATPEVPRWHLVVGAIGLFPLLASWTARGLRSLGEGMYTADTVWYHLPAAVRFLQTGSTTSIQFYDDGPVTAYFPMTSSLLHASGIALFGSDALSTLLNLGWLALALLAAWRVGAHFGVAVPATLAVGLLLAGPGMTETQAGSALNDVSGVALVLAAVALIVATPVAVRPRGQLVLVGLALGLAIGMKVTFLAPAVLLALALVATAGGGQRVRAVVVFAVACTTGAYWYVRNLVITGNPVPTLDAGLGPLRLDAVTGSPDARSVSHYLYDASAWERRLAPGFDDALGRVWFLLLALVLIGLIGTLVRPPRADLRLVAGVGLGSLVAFVYTPQFIDFLEGDAFFFATNLRYAAPAFALGLLLSAVVLRRFVVVMLPALALGLWVTQADAVSWPVLRSRESFFEDQIDGGSALAGVLVVLLVLAVVAVIARRTDDGGARLGGAAWLAVPLVVVVFVALAHPRYTDHRYRNSPWLRELVAWSQDRHDERIGTIGTYGQAQYPIAGSDLSNRVRYMVVETADGGSRPPETCEELMAIIEAGRFDHVVLVGLDKVQWVQTQADAVPVPEALGYSPEGLLPTQPVQVFALDPATRDRAC